MKDTLKIFVGNVDDRTTEEEVNDMFQKYGPVVSCAVMKQYAFVHMRGADRAKAAIEELNGRELHGKRLVVELSKPRPQNTWKIFVGNVSAACDASELRNMFQAYGRVVECDVVKDYAFVHMEKESDARAAIENLNGKEIKGKRINVEMSNKVSRPMSSNGSAHNNRVRRPNDLRESPQKCVDAYRRRRAAKAAYSPFDLKTPYEHYSGDNARYTFESRMRPPSPPYFSRDRSPLRRSPTRSPYGLVQSAAATTSITTKFRAPASGYGSLPSAYGDQAASSLSAAYASQSSLSTAYGTRAPTITSAYGTQGGYDSQPSAYGTETQPSYGAQSSTAYSAQASSLSASYGSHLATVAPSYSSQTLSNPYQTHSASSIYAPPSALASAYRPQQSSVYENTQMAGLGMQSAYSSMSTQIDAPMYERTRLSPPLSSASDSYKKTMDSYKSRLASDRRYSELAEYRRLTQESQDPFRRSPPKTQLDFRRMTESQSNYSAYPYSDFMKGSSLSGYTRRM